MPKRKLDNVRLHVLLTREQHKRLEKMSDKTNYSLSELIRRAIDCYLAEAKK